MILDRRLANWLQEGVAAIVATLPTEALNGSLQRER